MRKSKEEKRRNKKSADRLVIGIKDGCPCICLEKGGMRTPFYFGSREDVDKMEKLLDKTVELMAETNPEWAVEK